MELTEYDTAQGWQAGAIIEEKASGSKVPLHKRQGIKGLFSPVESKLVQTVLISDVTRLGSRTHDLVDVIERWHEHKVSLVIYYYKLELLGKRSRVNPLALSGHPAGSLWHNGSRNTFRAYTLWIG